jgi:hypothetical protein
MLRGHCLDSRNVLGAKQVSLRLESFLRLRDVASEPGG